MHNRRLPRLLMAAALGLTPILSAALSFAQVPPPVPALPDAERRTSYSISASTCACAVNFALFGSGTDVDSWLEVFVAGTRYLSTDPSHGWALTSATGTLATIPRPITNAILTFTAAQTGTIQIVGANRPRRLSQFQENAGVSARNLNQVITDILAQNRETWDKINDVTGRGFFAPPGSVGGIITGPLTGVIGAPASATANGLARWNGTTGAILKDSPLATLSDNGTLTINPAAGIIPGLTINQSLSGSTLPTGNAANLISIGDDRAAGGANFINGFEVSHVIGTSAMTGGRQTMASFLGLTNPTSASNTNRNYVAIYGNFYATSPDNGTDTGANAKGAGFGLATWSDLQSGATNWLDIGPEFDVSIRTGASAKNKHALSLITHALDAVSGANLDTLLSLSGQTGTIGVVAGITFDTHGGTAPTKTTGTGILVHDAMTMATFIDASLLTCTTLLKSTNFTQACNGNTTIGATAGSIALDINNNSNSASVPAAQAGVLARLVGPDSAAAAFGFDSFGNSNQLLGRRADGTAASKTGVIANDVLWAINGEGYTSAAAYSSTAVQIIMQAAEIFSGTANGTQISFKTTPNTTTTIATAMTIQNSGGVSIGGAADPGTGKMAVGTAYLVGTNQVVGARVTGYAAMTGTPDKATAYATSTVTLAQLAGRVMQLQADLTTHGLIGP